MDNTPEVFPQSDMHYHYAGLGVRLTSQQETYVNLRTRGINPLAAARGAGYANPKKAVAELSTNKSVILSIGYFREMARATAIQAGAIEFTKDDATLLYLEAHTKAANATEEIKAVDSLVKLHGLASPEKVELTVTSREQLHTMSDAELMKLTGEEILLKPEDYHEVKDV